MDTATFAPTTHSLLRTDQVTEMEDEKSVLEKKLHNPNIQDKGAVAEQLRRVVRQLESQRPKPFSSEEVDRAVKREQELREAISQGMLSHEEMRKCPPGAVDRHRRWEKTNKPLIQEWQNLQRRLHAGSDDHEVASIETFRPTGSTMNMDGALIAGKQFHFGPIDAGLPVTFNQEQLALLRVLNPQLADMLGTLSNRARADVKDALGAGIGLAEPSPASVAGHKGAAKKRVLSQAHKDKIAAGRKAAQLKKAA